MEGITDKILMVRPKHFGSNPDTIGDNHFQAEMQSDEVKSISEKALLEFDSMVAELTRHDIEVIVIEDTDTPIKPDAIFPNNWFSTHSNGSIITYPMKADSRQKERREDIVEQLTESYGYKKRYGFEYHEADDQYLEGTGSMVLDRENKVIYAGLSQRTEIKVLEKFAVLLAYEKIIFHPKDRNGKAIYHTNVMMAMGSDYVIICSDSIPDETEQKEVLNKLKSCNKEVINISLKQMDSFAGNMLQVKSKLGQPYLIMSQTAFKSLSIDQIDRINSYNKIIQIPIPIIEKYGGGSVRCMMAEIFEV